jgi:Zn-dependent alcohol dehydrogenase
MAETLGAHLTITSDEQAADELQKATSGLGAMVVIDFVGNDSTLAMAARMTRKQGKLWWLASAVEPCRFGRVVCRLGALLSQRWAVRQANWLKWLH